MHVRASLHEPCANCERTYGMHAWAGCRPIDLRMVVRAPPLQSFPSSDMPNPVRVAAGRLHATAGADHASSAPLL